MISPKSRNSNIAIISWAGAGLLGALFLCAVPEISYAGFDWTPPPKTAQQEVPVVRAGAGMALPAGAVSMEPLLEEFEGSEFSPIKKQIIGPDGRILSEAPGQIYDEIEGFGSDLPLALAMQQIVPPSYAYSFDKTVDPSIKVSWSGGKPWNLVLKEAVAPYELDVIIADQTAWLLPASVVAEHNMQKVAVGMPAKDHAIAALKQEVYADGAITRIQAEPLMPMGGMEEEPKAASAAETENERLRRIGMDEGAYSPSYPRRNAAPVAMAATEPQGPTSLAPRRAASKPASSLGASFAMKSWTASRGESLYDILNRWSAGAAVTLLWQGDKDYRLPADLKAQGSYPEAVMTALAQFDDQTPRPMGRLHTNQPQGPVLVINSAERY